MALNFVNVGSSPNDGTGDRLRDAFTKCNSNFNAVSGADNGSLSAAQFFITAPTVPSTTSSPGTAGEIAWDSNYVYICVSTNVWKRSPISIW